METYSIQHQVGIKATADAVYEALTDTTKLAGWWTADTRGNGSEVGGVLEFWFGDFCQKFEVVELQPDRRVRWKAIGNKSMDEWDGTEVAFSLKRRWQADLCQLQSCGLAAEQRISPALFHQMGGFHVEPQGPSGKREGTAGTRRRGNQL